MAYPKDELPPPAPARDDAQAFELARVWFADGAPRVAARLELWPDPAAWGLLLGDVARQLAARHAEAADTDVESALARIRAGLDAELGAAGEGA